MGGLLLFAQRTRLFGLCVQKMSTDTGMGRKEGGKKTTQFLCMNFSTHFKFDTFPEISLRISVPFQK